MIPTNAYDFLYQATDSKANASDLAYGPVFTVDALAMTTATFAGTWSTNDSPTAWLATTTSTSQPSASATLALSFQRLGIVASTGPGFADLEIYVDDQLAQTVHTAADAPTSRVIVAQVAADGCGSHTLRVARAAAGTGPVELEGFVVLRS